MTKERHRNLTARARQLEEARRVYARALLNRRLAGEQDSTGDIADEAIVTVMENRLIAARRAYDRAAR